MGAPPFLYADPVQPDAVRFAQLRGELLAEALRHERRDAARIDRMAARLRAVLADSGCCRINYYVALCRALAGFALDARGDMPRDIARKDLVAALGEATLTLVYQMVSRADGVPERVVRRELAAWIEGAS